MIVTRGVRLFITYYKENKKAGKVYFGRASALVDGLNLKNANYVKKRRDSSHQKNKEGYAGADIDKISTNYDAIRGREDMLIRKAKENEISGNKNNGISKRNKKREQYLNAAIDLFGDVLLGLLIYSFYL